MLGVAALVGLDVAGSDLVAVGQIAIVVVCYAIGPAILSRWMSDLPGIGVVAVSLAIAAVVYIPVVTLFGGWPTEVPSVAVILSVVAARRRLQRARVRDHVRADRRDRPDRMTTITYVNPAVAIIAGAIILDEAITIWTVVGFVLVVAGVPGDAQAGRGRNASKRERHLSSPMRSCARPDTSGQSPLVPTLPRGEVHDVALGVDERPPLGRVLIAEHSAAGREDRLDAGGSLVRRNRDGALPAARNSEQTPEYATRQSLGPSAAVKSGLLIGSITRRRHRGLPAVVRHCRDEQPSSSNRGSQRFARSPLSGGLRGCRTGIEPQPHRIHRFPDPVAISGSGSQVTRLTIPDGAQSLRVSLACTTGDFHISANTDLANDRHGRCGGMTTVILPLATASWMEVTVAVDPAESLVGELEFSAQPISVDPEIAEDCEALGLDYGLYQDAEIGLETGRIEEAAWRAAIDEATATLDGMTPSPMIEPQVAVLLDWISAVEASGFGKSGTGPEVYVADNLAGQVCTDNGSTIRVLRQYGG